MSGKRTLIFRCQHRRLVLACPSGIHNEFASAQRSATFFLTGFNGTHQAGFLIEFDNRTDAKNAAFSGDDRVADGNALPDAVLHGASPLSASAANAVAFAITPSSTNQVIPPRLPPSSIFPWITWMTAGLGRTPDAQ